MRAASCLLCALFLLTRTGALYKESLYTLSEICVNVTYGTVIHEISADSINRCAVQCSTETGCSSFVYKNDTKVCKLNDEKYAASANASHLICIARATYGQKLDTPRCEHGEACTVPVNDLRLCDGGGEGICDTKSGRVEVYYEGQWGTVCDDFWNDYDYSYYYYGPNAYDQNANVVCKILGFKNGTSISNGFITSGTGPQLLDNVRCHGTETSLFDCPSSGVGINNCRRSEDVGVECG